MTTATTCLNFMGADFLAEIELTVSDWGASATHNDPGWGPEFYIDSITLREERIEWHPVDKFGYKSCREWLGPPFEATGALFQTLAASRAIDDAILQTLSEAQSASPYFEDYDDRDYSDRD